MKEMLRIHQIRCEIGHTPDRDDIARKLRCSPADITSFEIEKESLDARRDDLHYSYTVLADVKNPSRHAKKKDVSFGTKQIYQMPKRNNGTMERPVVVGFGPAGMFASLILAECGYRPIVI